LTATAREVLEQTGEVRVTARRKRVQSHEQSPTILIGCGLPMVVRMRTPHREPIKRNVEHLAEANSVIERHRAALAPSRQSASGHADLCSERGKLSDPAPLDRDTNALAASTGVGAIGFSAFRG
jgi:hypothetical protein